MPLYSYYETNRETALETGVTSGSESKRETIQEYSVPFGSHSVAPHLVTQFIVSGVTDFQVGDDINGVYTARHAYDLTPTGTVPTGFPASSGQVWWFGPNGHEIKYILTPTQGSVTSVKFEWSDTDNDPYMTSSIVSVTGLPTNKVKPPTTESLLNLKLFPWATDFTDDTLFFIGDGITLNLTGIKFTTLGADI